MNPPKLTPQEQAAVQKARTEKPHILGDVQKYLVQLKQNAARLIVDYVYHVSRQCVFKPVLNSRSEWLLEPDKWIGLQFAKWKIHVSVHVTEIELKSLEPRCQLDIRRGRYPGQARFTIKSLADVPLALRYIESAFFKSDNEYRKSHGKPEKHGND